MSYTPPTASPFLDLADRIFRNLMRTEERAPVAAIIESIDYVLDAADHDAASCESDFDGECPICRARAAFKKLRETNGPPLKPLASGGKPH